MKRICQFKWILLFSTALLQACQNNETQKTGQGIEVQENKSQTTKNETNSELLNKEINNFSLESWDGSGSIRLKIHTDSLFLFSHTGPIDIHVEGIAGYVYAYNNGNGFIYLQNLKSPRVFVNASGTGDTHIAPLQYTGYEIYSYGNIYCYTHPSILYEVTKGKGSFILVN